MKYAFYFFAIYWAISFVTFILGVYHPSNVTIGCAMFMSALYFLTSAREAD